MPTEQETTALVEAVWQLLDDMGKEGQSVCLYAKAQARLAYQPFALKGDLSDANWMTAEEAQRIINEPS